LVAPLVFLIFLGAVQLCYMSLVFFTVQKAAVTVCQNAAASPSPSQYNPRFDIIYQLTPLAKINPQLAEMALGTQCQIEETAGEVQVTLRYPMVIWIPLLKGLFGEPWIPVLDRAVPDARLTSDLFTLMKLPPPLLGASMPPIPYVHWFTVKVRALNENGVIPLPEMSGL